MRWIELAFCTIMKRFISAHLKIGWHDLQIRVDSPTPTRDILRHEIMGTNAIFVSYHNKKRLQASQLANGHGNAPEIWLSELGANVFCDELYGDLICVPAKINYC